jgi:hypothetical protein
MSWMVGTCLVSVSMVFLSIAGLLRLLPRFLHLIRLGSRSFLILSFRFYHLLLTRMAPVIQQHLNIHILVGHARVVATLLLSLSLGLLFLALTNLPVTRWSVGLSLLHGLAVGLAWDEIEKPGGLQLGVKIQ